MTEVQQPPLNWEASATATHPQVSSSLPSEVEACLKNARFVCVCDLKSPWEILTQQTATSCDMRCLVSPYLSDELYIPSLDALQPQPSYYNDHEPIVQKDFESD